MNELTDRFNPKGLDYPENKEVLAKALNDILGVRKKEQHAHDMSANVTITITSFNGEAVQLKREEDCGSCLKAKLTERMVEGRLSDIWPDILVDWDDPDTQSASPAREEAPTNHPQAKRPAGGINFR